MSRFSCAVLLAGFAAVALAAQQQQQQPPPPPPQPPTFRAEANLVRVDVTVVDRHGEPMTTLTADDFAVEEDGAPQTIQSFKFVSADGQPSSGDEDSLPIRSPEHAAAEAARDEVRVFVIFWDEYHIGRFAEAIKGRRALTTFVTTAFGPSDLVALMDPLLPVDALKFTRDRRELSQKIAKLEGRFGVYMPTRSAAEDNMLERGRDIARIRSEVTISALQSAAVHLGSIKEGRKAIIFVSEGLTGLGMDQLSLISELTQTANNNNTAIYTVDPAGLTGGGSPDVLRTIAENTGAEAFLNTNTPERALRQVVREASAFYLLGYASTRNPQDGKFHKIGVKVKRSGLDVRARRGYWAPGATEIEKARAEAAAAGAIPADVTKAMTVLSAARAERLVDMWVGAERGADGQPAVTVAWTPRAAAGRANASRTVSLIVKGPDGDRTFDASLDAGALSFPAPPGTVQLQLTIRDAAGTILDEDRRPFSVPDLSGPQLALGAPILLRARTVADARTLAEGRQALPFAGREFNRTDHVFVRFMVYGGTASEAAASARLTTKAGVSLLELPIAKMPQSERMYQVELPLASIARGDYLIAVAAEHGEERARALVPLRVVAY